MVQQPPSTAATKKALADLLDVFKWDVPIRKDSGASVREVAEHLASNTASGSDDRARVGRALAVLAGREHAHVGEELDG